MKKFVKTFVLGIVATSCIATSAFASINTGYIQVLPSSNSNWQNTGVTNFVEGVGKTGTITLVPTSGSIDGSADLEQYCNGVESTSSYILRASGTASVSKSVLMKTGCTYRLKVSTYAGAKGYISNGVN